MRNLHRLRPSAEAILPKIQSRLHSLYLPLLPDEETGWTSRHLFGGTAGAVGDLGCHVSALAPGVDLPLEEDMVLALEPKIGLPGTGMVGVENTFQVTPSGGRCFTGQDFDIIAVSPSGPRGRSS